MNGGFNETVTVIVPVAFKRRLGRNRVVAPDGTELTSASSSEPEIDSVLVKAIARACRWQRMLDSGEHATLRELAKSEWLNLAYVSRVLRLTLFAPACVEAVIGGRQTAGLTTKPLIAGLPIASKSNPWNISSWKCFNRSASRNNPAWLSRKNSPAATRNPQVPAAGSQMMSCGDGAIISTIMPMMCRGVRNCPFCPAVAILDSMYS